MTIHASVAERVVYGRPIDPAIDEPEVRVIPRPGTALLGRILISPIFIFSGIEKLAHTDQTAQMMAGAGVPSAHALAIIAGLAEVIGGLAVLTGFLSRIAAIGLILFLIPTTLIFHAFWNAPDAEQQMQMANFMKNVTIMGGLFLLVAYGAGRYSLDARLRRPMQA
jgi:putative oxidoreductase